MAKIWQSGFPVDFSLLSGGPHPTDKKQEKGSSGRTRTYNPPVNSDVTTKTRKDCPDKDFGLKRLAAEGSGLTRHNQLFLPIPINSTNSCSGTDTKTDTTNRRRLDAS